MTEKELETQTTDPGTSAEALTQVIDETTDQSQIKVIEKAVKNLSKTDTGLAQLQKRYGNLSIKGPDDRAGYIAVVEGAKLVKDLRISVENKRKELNEFPLKFQRAVNAEAKRITEQIQPLEQALITKKTDYENAEAAAKKAKTEQRIKDLIAAGYQVNGQFYICGMFTLTEDKVADMDEDTFKHYIQQAEEEKRIAEIAAARKKQEDAELKAAAEQLKKDREALVAEKAELQKLREELVALKESLQPKPTETEAAEQPKTSAHGSFIPEGLKANVVEHPAPRFEDAPREHLEQIAQNIQTADEIDEMINSSGYSTEYIHGFEHCREKVLDIFADETPRKRGDFIAAIKAITA